MKNLLKSLGIILTIIFVSSCEEKPVPPVLSTAPITAISTTGAVSGGNVTDDGGAKLVYKGVCWGLSDNPVIEDNKTTESGATASFSSNITNLTPNTSYYVRAYATNSAGTGYGSSVSFKTLGDKPSSSTVNASSILTTSATLNGTVNPNSLATTVTFEYGLTTSYGSTSPATQSPLSGDSNGNVTSALSGLTPGKTYHFRIKVENSLGITFSSDLSFTTLGNVPAAITQATNNLKVNTVTINGSVNPNDLPTTVVFEWGTTTNYGNIITSTQNPGSGNTSVIVSADLSGLIPETAYHFRIKATNELGTTIGDDMVFKTYGAVDIENNGYKTVTIGTQTWFSENLKSSKYNNGDIIETTSSEDIANESNPKYQWIYIGNEGWANIAGRYYTWYAATDSRNICPTGWHVPTADEFHSLIYYLYINGYGYEGTGWDIAKTLAATFGWRDDLTPGNPGNDQATNNSTGFTAIPAGFRHLQLLFLSTGQNAIFWTTTLKDEPDAFVQQLGFQYGTVALTYYNKKNGLSVRCLKD